MFKSDKSFRSNAINEISNDLCGILGDEWKSILKNTEYYVMTKMWGVTQGYHNYSDVWDVAFHIWLSNIGLLSIYNLIYITKTKISGIETHNRDIKEIRLSIAKKIEQNIQKHHGDRYYIDFVLNTLGDFEMMSWFYRFDDGSYRI